MVPDTFFPRKRLSEPDPFSGRAIAAASPPSGRQSIRPLRKRASKIVPATFFTWKRGQRESGALNSSAHLFRFARGYADKNSIAEL